MKKQTTNRSTVQCTLYTIDSAIANEIDSS